MSLLAAGVTVRVDVTVVLGLDKRLLLFDFAEFGRGTVGLGVGALLLADHVGAQLAATATHLASSRLRTRHSPTPIKSQLLCPKHDHKIAISNDDYFSPV